MRWRSMQHGVSALQSQGLIFLMMSPLQALPLRPELALHIMQPSLLSLRRRRCLPAKATRTLCLGPRHKTARIQPPPSAGDQRCGYFSMRLVAVRERDLPLRQARSMALQAPGVAQLPPMSQLDAEVLDSLPLGMKRELELAYGTLHQAASVLDHCPRSFERASQASFVFWLESEPCAISPQASSATGPDRGSTV